MWLTEHNIQLKDYETARQFPAGNHALKDHTVHRTIGAIQRKNIKSDTHKYTHKNNMTIWNRKFIDWHSKKKKTKCQQTWMVLFLADKYFVSFFFSIANKTSEKNDRFPTGIKEIL